MPTRTANSDSTASRGTFPKLQYFEPFDENQEHLNRKVTVLGSPESPNRAVPGLFSNRRNLRVAEPVRDYQTGEIRAQPNQ